MTELRLTFGYYPHALDIDHGNLHVRTLDGLKQKVALVMAEGVVQDWVYAPLQEVSQFGSGGRQLRTMPYTSRVFGLETTHQISHDAPDNLDQLTFLIWALSFFLGMRLTATARGFLDATPVVRGELVDFGLRGRDLPKALSLADEFWLRHRKDQMLTKRLAAAIHALFLGQYPQGLQYERFIHLYAALDACFALASSTNVAPKRLPHSRRIAWMCGLFEMPVPEWANGAASGGKAEIAALRNDTIHEALFVGEPLGFAIHGRGTNRNLTLEMQALICRFLIALLGASETSYVRSRIDTRQRHILEL